jgi:hypothetical protein
VDSAPKGFAMIVSRLDKEEIVAAAEVARGAKQE